MGRALGRGPSVRLGRLLKRALAHRPRHDGSGMGQWQQLRSGRGAVGLDRDQGRAHAPVLVERTIPPMEFGKLWGAGQKSGCGEGLATLRLRLAGAPAVPHFGFRTAKMCLSTPRVPKLNQGAGAARPRASGAPRASPRPAVRPPPTISWRVRPQPLTAERRRSSQGGHDGRSVRRCGAGGERA